MDENLCVCCGAQIPEGWQVCKQCANKKKEIFVAYVYKHGLELGSMEGTYMECAEWADSMFDGKGADMAKIDRKD